MLTLEGMAEHIFRNVYHNKKENKPCIVIRCNGVWRAGWNIQWHSTWRGGHNIQLTNKSEKLIT